MSAFVEDESVLARDACAPDATIALGALPEQIADLRHGDTRAESRPLLAIIHGGFWRPRYDRTHTAPMACALAALGWSVASIEYRRIPGEPDASVTDVIAALAALPAQAKHHNGRVIAIGHSAGGHLALLAAQQPPPALHAVLTLAPVADLRLAESMNLGDGAVAAFLGRDAASRADLDPRQRPAPVIPTTIVQGHDDSTVPPTIARAFVHAHAQTRLRELHDCGHYAVIDPLSKHWAAVIEEIERLAPLS